MSGAAFSRQVSVFVSRHLSPEARSRALAAAAIQGRQELIRSGRASPTYQTSVDGREGAPEGAVKPEGVIVYRFSLLGEAAVFAMAFLRARSPVGGAKPTGQDRFDGHYRDQFVYAIGQRGTISRTSREAKRYIGNRIIRPESFDPQRVEADVGEILIVNRSPYARKVDVQLIGNRRLRFSVPPDLFDDAAAAVRKRFPSLDARRVYQMTFPGQYVRKTGRIGAFGGRVVENPALVIGVR